MASPDSNQQLQQPAWPAYEPTKDCSQGFCSIYCPQWCYIVFPPPPPFSFDEADDSSTGPTFSPLVIAIIGILASAFLLVSYYTVVSKYCGGSFCRPRRRRHPNPLVPDDDNDVEADNDDDTGNHRHEVWHIPPTVGLDETLISKITVCKYKRGDGLVDCTDCSVCLGEFRDDESLRLLPKCSHAFHVQCIDTWLRSHSNCPLCRANIVLVNPAVPQLVVPPLPPETNQSEGVQNDETVVAIGELDEGTSLGNDSDTSSKEVLEAHEANHDVIEVRDDNEEVRDDNEDQRMRRSFSLGSFHRSRVSVADILQVDLEDEDPEILVGSASSSERGGGEHGKGGSRSRTLHNYVTSSVPMKRSMSSGRFTLTRQGRGRSSVLPI